MATTIKMPQLGESVTEGTIERWLVKEGDTVEQYDPLFEVVTDKVNAEVPAEVFPGNRLEGDRVLGPAEPAGIFHDYRPQQQPAGR